MNGYQLKGLSTFKGHDGNGFNATLYRDGKKVAHIHDGAYGGCYDWNWFDRAEEKVLIDIVAKMPASEYDGIMLPVTIDSFVGEMVDELNDAKFFKQKCKTKICVRFKEHKKGEYVEYKTQYTPEIAKRLRDKYPNIIEIINETVGCI